jgi:hypothetical protein
MTDDRPTIDRLVQAVAEALDRPQPYGGCTHPDDKGRYYGPCVVCDAAAVVAALVPLIRAQVAEDLLAWWECDHPLIARVTEGTDR